MTEPKEDQMEKRDQLLVTGVKLAGIVAGLVMSCFLISLDNVILATAIPRITEEFKTLDDIAWWGSSYLLTTCAFQLMFGKLYTLFDVKSVYMGVLVIFGIGSAIAGAAPTSMALIIGRAIAGIGCSGLMSGTIIVIAAIVPLPQRPMYMGMFGAIHVIASVVGPLLGGVFTDKLTWRWCFYINLPVSFAALVLVFLLLPSTLTTDKNVTKRPMLQRLKEVDPSGTALIIVDVVLLLLVLQWGGITYPWSSPRVIVLLVLFVVIGIGFVVFQIWLDKKSGSADNTPALPLRLLTQSRTVAGAAWFGFITAGADFLLRYYLPVWFQAIKGATAVQSGLMNLALVLTTAMTTTLGGVATTIVGYTTPFLILASVFESIAAGLLTTFTTDTPPSQWIGYQLLYGIGCGLVLQTPIIATHAVLPENQVPLGTSVIMFLQTLGGAVGLSVGQNVFLSRLQSGLQHVPGIDVTAVLNAGATGIRDPKVVSPDLLSRVLDTYNRAIIDSWKVSVGFACISILGSVSTQWVSLKNKKEEAQPMLQAK